jgi:hypothetical protein
VSGWQYKQTSISASFYSSSKGFDDSEVNAHLAEMADAGWELVTATSTIRETTPHYGSRTEGHHFIWKRPR